MRLGADSRPRATGRRSVVEPVITKRVQVAAEPSLHDNPIKQHMSRRIAQALQGSGADVLLTAATPKFAAQAVRKVYDIDWKPTHFLTNVSISVGAVMRPAGLEKGVGIISAGYLKEPTDPQWQDTPEYRDWLAWIKKYNTSGSLTDSNNVTGYSVTQTLVAVLKACGDDLRRENIMKQAASIHDLKLPMLLPGITISTTADNFAPIKQMQLMKFDGATWKLFGEVISGSGS